VALASSLSTEDSPRFVNGLLSRLLALKPMLALLPGRSRSPQLARGCDNLRRRLVSLPLAYLTWSSP
jgi:hypothetical protein